MALLDMLSALVVFQLQPNQLEELWPLPLEWQSLLVSRYLPQFVTPSSLRFLLQPSLAALHQPVWYRIAVDATSLSIVLQGLSNIIEEMTVSRKFLTHSYSPVRHHTPRPHQRDHHGDKGRIEVLLNFKFSRRTSHIGQCKRGQLTALYTRYRCKDRS